ncbi:MAG TPA: hypothetical protein PLK76_01220 [bacterium]|nr:hypothetical protein [bacterium]
MRLDHIESWPSFLDRLERILEFAKLHSWTALKEYETNLALKKKK